MNSVKWGEFRLGDLFEIVGTKSIDSNAVDFVDNGINFVGRTFENNGIQGYINRMSFDPNAPFTITATVIGNYKYVKFQKQPYYCSQNINKLTPKNIISRWNEYIAYYFVTIVQQFVSIYDGQQGGYKLDDINNFTLNLPIIQSGDIDYDSIETLMRELEDERISVVSAYLKSVGLDNYILTEFEERSFKTFNTLKWKLFRIGNLFNKIKTNKIPYKAKDLPQSPDNEYTLPCLTSSFMNQGLNYFAPKQGATILKNVISIPSNSDVYRAYYQSNEFTVLSDAYAVQWKNSNQHLFSSQYLFMVACINKVTDLPLYSYKNKLGGWNVVKNKEILLPVNDSEQPDLLLMGNLITAIQKILIKDVVKYVNKKLEYHSEN